MEPATGIRKLGFKRWFERELIESHAYLVTLFLCLVLVIALFEHLSSRTGGFDRVLMYASMLAGGAIGIFSLNRYIAILFRALRLSRRAICENCGAYSRFSVLDSGRADIEEESGRDGTWLKLSCSGCGHEWTMS